MKNKKIKLTLSFLIITALFTFSNIITVKAEGMGSIIDCQEGQVLEVPCKVDGNDTSILFIPNGQNRDQSNEYISISQGENGTYNVTCNKNSGGYAVPLKCEKKGQTGPDYYRKEELIGFLRVRSNQAVATNNSSNLAMDNGNYTTSDYSASGATNTSINQNVMRDYSNANYSLADDTGSSYTSATSAGSQNSGGSVNGKETKLSGNVCQYYQICRTRNVSKEEGTPKQNKKGETYYVGPYLAYQGNLMYEATPQNCSNGANVIAALCLEGQYDGPAEEGGCLDYKAAPIDTNSLYQVGLYELYKMSEGEDFSNPETYFTYEAAARVLAYLDTTYEPRTGVTKDSNNNYASHYKENGDIGSVNGPAREKAQKAYEDAQNEKENIMDGTYGLRIAQNGGAMESGDGFKQMFSVQVQNVSSESDISFGDLSFEPGVSQVGDGEYNEDNKTMTFMVALDGIQAQDGQCSEGTIKATLNKGNSSLRNALIVDANDRTSKANHQRFVIFTDNSGSVSYELPYSSCAPENPGEGTCQPDAVLNCDDANVNSVIVNEGAQGGGETDWEGCIIGNTDSQGNSYDVVDNSEFEQTSEVGEQSDNIQGYTSDGTELTDSSYCTVSCKEKYEFILPGYKEEVKQGTYFSFHANAADQQHHTVVGIKATRECVSAKGSGGNAGEGIEKDKYNARAKDLRAQMVDYMNAYLYFYQIHQALYTKEAARMYNGDALQPVQDDEQTYGCNWSNHQPADEIIEEFQRTDENLLLQWNYDGVSIDKFYYYTLENAGDIEGGKLVKHEVELDDVTRSYKEFIEEVADEAENKPEIEKVEDPLISSMGFDFYKEYYEQYDVFHEGIDPVEGWEDQDQKEYEHQWGIQVDPQTCEMQDPREHTLTVRSVHYGTELSEEWTEDNDDIDAQKYDQLKKYKEALDKIEETMKTAKEMFDTLVEQISIQNVSIQECTNYLGDFDENKMPFNYNPTITFNYPDQDEYMAMLSPSILELADGSTPTPGYSAKFCESDTSAQGVLDGCDGDGGTEKDYEYIYKIELDPHGKQMEKIKDTEGSYLQEYDPEDEENNDKVTYHDAARTGSVATWDNGSGDFIYYRSPKQFYVTAPDGIVTNAPLNANSSIIDTDGRVYPVSINTKEGQYPFYVTLSNIGQFNESGGLGRIMGGGDGKPGTMTGEGYNIEVCYYEVCRVDDPTCKGKPDQNTCRNKQDGLDYPCTDSEDCARKCPDPSTDKPGGPTCNYIDVERSINEERSIEECEGLEGDKYTECVNKICPSDRGDNPCKDVNTGQPVYCHGDKDCIRKFCKQPCVNQKGEEYYCELEDGTIDQNCVNIYCPNVTEDGPTCTYKGVEYSLAKCVGLPDDQYQICKKAICPEDGDGGGPGKNCNDIVKDSCSGTNQGYRSKFYLSDSNFVSCLQTLLDSNCCDQVTSLLQARKDGAYKYGNGRPAEIANEYTEKCDNSERECQYFNIVSQESYSSNDSILTDNSRINNDGSLQFNARTISNNNVFPNGNNSVNWTTTDARSVIQHIEQEGDGIFDKNPEYQITMTQQCVRAIKEYNKKQEGSNGEFSNGGFNDYTLTITNAQTSENLSKSRIGTTAVMSEEYKNILTRNCNYKYDGNSANTIQDSSEVLT